MYPDDSTREIETLFADSVVFVHVAQEDDRFNPDILCYLSRVKLLSRVLQKSLAPSHTAGRPPKSASSLPQRLHRIVPAVQKLIYTETKREDYGIFESTDRLNVWYGERAKA